jgi:hypothetical protein
MDFKLGNPLERRTLETAQKQCSKHEIYSALISTPIPLQVLIISNYTIVGLHLYKS